MNWITKFIKPKIKSLFKKKTSTTEESLWISCECKNLIYKEDFEKNFFCCPKCGVHHKLSCKDRFKILRLESPWYVQKLRSFVLDTRK